MLLSRTVAVILLAAVSTGRAAEFEKVLTFVQADQVRIVSTLKGDQRLDGVEITGRIVGGDGKVLWQGVLGRGVLDADSPLIIEQTIENLRPRLWSPSDPALYELTVTAARQGRAIAEKQVRFGFRSFTSEDGQFRLNGKPIFLRGLAINPPGRTIPEEVGHSRAFAESYVRYLRGQNINIIRLEPESQVWFDVCDELGMMVFQGPYGAPPAGPGEGGNKNRVPEYVERSVEGYKQIFETYLHHPSIVIYVMSNELPYTGNLGKQWHAFLTDAHARLKEWFPTQQFIGNAGYGEGKEGDINDVHRYWGWYYNTFLTYYNLRDPHLFGDADKVQPFTFSECVGAFTGPLGSFNLIERKQVAAAMNWTGYTRRSRSGGCGRSTRG
jgi:beta-galactosidase